MVIYIWTHFTFHRAQPNLRESRLSSSLCLGRPNVPATVGQFANAQTGKLSATPFLCPHSEKKIWNSVWTWLDPLQIHLFDVLLQSFKFLLSILSVRAQLTISDPLGLLRPRRVKWLRLRESLFSSWPWALRPMALSGAEWFSSSSSTVACSNGRMTPCWHCWDISGWNQQKFTVETTWWSTSWLS